MTNDPNRATGEAMPLAIAPAAAAAQTAVDPLLNLIRAYRAEGELLDSDDDHAEEHSNWLYDRLTHDTPECWTTEGAAEALRFVADQLAVGNSEMQLPILASVMAFLEHRG